MTDAMRLTTRDDADRWADEMGYDPADAARWAAWIWAAKPCQGCRYDEHPLATLSDADALQWMATPGVLELRTAIARSGLSARQYAMRVLARDERTVRRWLSGESPVPAAVLAYLE